MISGRAQRIRPQRTLLDEAISVPRCHQPDSYDASIQIAEDGGRWKRRSPLSLAFNLSGPLM
jgi:hypothetical protein